MGIGNMNWRDKKPPIVLWLTLLFGLIDHGHTAEQRVVCYYTNWSVYRPGTAKFSPQNINPYLCTHLIYAFGGFTKDNTLKPFDKYQDIEKGGYAKFTGLKTYNKNLKTMLAIGGWNEGSARFSPMVADPERRREFVKNSVKFLRQNFFDGLDLDWEYPAYRDGGKPRDKNNYADLVQELREEFERESSKTGRPRLLLSMAIPAGIEYLEKGYDLPRLNEYLDFFNLLSYDYHSAFEPAVNHHSPLYGLLEDNEYNYDNELTIDYTISYLIKHDVSTDKIVMGIPTYGRSYTLFNPDATEIGSPADGPGEEGDATREKGYLAYYEICENIAKSEDWQVVQPNPKAMGPYAFKDNQWVGYDDENIVRIKANYVNEKKLGGIMFWSIDNDDFRGKCHNRPYPLIEAAKEAMLSSNEGGGGKNKVATNRKKIRPTNRSQDNSSGRGFRNEKKRLSTTTPVPSKRRISTQRVNNSFKVKKQFTDDEDDNNSVKETSKNRSKNRSNRRGSHKKVRPNIIEDQLNEYSPSEEHVIKTSTTPEPPTTPDPGSDFKCEDEGFFSHPRDCKKYFWCLDSGPGGLGIVAHQFTCPSGLVFNKGADSCDYPRNVVCPKSKSGSTSTTTKAPTTTRGTTARRTTTTTTTSKPDSDEEYEYYDDDDEEESLNITEEEIENVKPVTTTSKPLVYKTITRNKPTTTEEPITTTVTEIASKTPVRHSNAGIKKVFDLPDEEDPQVIKKLIDLIKQAGGLEELEKQLKLQESHSSKVESNGNEQNTPATISKSLYERVLNRQNTRANGVFATSTARTSGINTESSTKSYKLTYQNGPGKSQFEGLEDIPEVKSLRRAGKPYVTIERQRISTEVPSEENDDDNDGEEEEEIVQEELTSFEKKFNSSPKKATPSYVNIKRFRPTTPANENDVGNKDNGPEEDQTNLASQEHENKKVNRNKNDEEEVAKEKTNESEMKTDPPKSRYSSIERPKSTNVKLNEETISTDEIKSSETTTVINNEGKILESLISSTESLDLILPEITKPKINTESSLIIKTTISTPTSTFQQEQQQPTVNEFKLQDNLVTDLPLTTLPAISSTKSELLPVTRVTTAASQPRPFGFPRRGRPTASTSTTTPVTTEQPKAKVEPVISILMEPKNKTNNLFNLIPVKIINDIDNENDTNQIGYLNVSNNFNIKNSILKIQVIDLFDENKLIRKRTDFDTETTIKPTTFKGKSIELLSSTLSSPPPPSPRGFFITKSEDEYTTVKSIDQSTSTSLNNINFTRVVINYPDEENVNEITSITDSLIDINDNNYLSNEVNDKEDTSTSNNTSTHHNKVLEGITTIDDSKIEVTTTSPPTALSHQSFRNKIKLKRRKIIIRKPSDKPMLDDQIHAESRFEDDDDDDDDNGSIHRTSFIKFNESADYDEINQINLLRNPSLRTPGSIRRDGFKTTRNPSVNFHRKQSTGRLKSSDLIDQSGRAQELAVSLADPPSSTVSIESGIGTESSLKIRGIQRYKIEITESPIESSSSTSSGLASGSSIGVQRRRQKPHDLIITSTSRPSRHRRPPNLDYDYYDDDEEMRLSLKPELKDKIYLTKRGNIRCLDQGNFPHPTSCKKFITCAKMLNQVVATEYTCPDKLSFDPVGGICNWSAGIGCKDSSISSRS